MNQNLANFLLQGVKAFAGDPHLLIWQDFSREEFFQIVTELFGKQDLSQVVITLEKIAGGELTANIPPNLKELVQKLEDVQSRNEEIKMNARRWVRQYVVAQYLIKEGKFQPPDQPAATTEPLTKTRPVITTTSPATPPLNPSSTSLTAGAQSLRPAPQPPTSTPTTESVPSEVYLVKNQVSAPILKEVTNAISSLPLQIIRGTISLGQEALGKQNPQGASTLALAQVGVTAQSLTTAANNFSQTASLSERHVAQAILKQASILNLWERQHPLLSSILNTINHPENIQWSMSTRPPIAGGSGEPTPQLKAKLEVFKLKLDLNQKLVGVENTTGGNRKNILTSLGQSPLVRTITSPLRNLSANIISRLQIITIRAPQDLKSALGFGPVGLPTQVGQIGQMATRAITGPGQTLTARGLQAGFSGMGKFLGGGLNFLKGLTSLGGVSVSGVFGGTIAGVSGGIVLAVIIGIFAVLILLTMININTHQSAFLGGAEEESKYINIVKTTPQTIFTNDNLPDSISYTITVSPKSGKLTAATIEDKFTVSKQGSAPTIPSQSWTADEIIDSWQKTFTVDVSQIKEQLKDSLLINTVTVSASVEKQPTQTNSTTVTIIIGSPPQDCPSGWPLEHGTVTQGPDGVYSHQSLEALDIGGNEVGTPVFTSHQGRAIYTPTYGGGNVVEVVGVCNGKEFRSRYVHLSSYNADIINRNVNKGERVGNVGNTGAYTTGPHLHYQFIGLPIEPPFIPLAIKRGCADNCGVSW
ncbi:M23 family metallopeptidase [Candidatus Microgenomates bacterium]|nr:M23 family metallopeptidase [Candidatus Microgenomates bacterium]